MSKSYRWPKRKDTILQRITTRQSLWGKQLQLASLVDENWEDFRGATNIQELANTRAVKAFCEANHLSTTYAASVIADYVINL
jgi:hypothetical protein